MMKMVSRKARPVITWDGGTCWVPSAFLSKPSTTTILVNEVMRINTNGASDRAPNTMIITSGLLSSTLPPPWA